MTIANHSSKRQGWLASLLLIPILIAAAVVGFFLFALILGLIFFAATVLLLRLWWLRRKMRTVAPDSQSLRGEDVVIRESTPNDDNARRRTARPRPATRPRR